MEINFPKTMVRAITGKVPNPKENIRRLLLKILPVAMAEAMAIYTNPQGKKPLSRPIYK